MTSFTACVFLARVTTGGGQSPQSNSPRARHGQRHLGNDYLFDNHRATVSMPRLRPAGAGTDRSHGDGGHGDLSHGRGLPRGCVSRESSDDTERRHGDTDGHGISESIARKRYGRRKQQTGARSRRLDPCRLKLAAREMHERNYQSPSPLLDATEATTHR